MRTPKILEGIHGKVLRVYSGTNLSQMVRLQLKDTPLIVTRHIKKQADGRWYMAVANWTDPIEIGEVLHDYQG